VNMSFLLLQTYNRYIGGANEDISVSRILLIILMVILALALILPFTPFFKKFLLRTYGRRYKLSKEQYQLLYQLIKRYHVSKPWVIFSDGQVLNEMLRRALTDIKNNRELTDTEQAAQSFLLFKLKHSIDIGRPIPKEIYSTRDLKIHDKLLITAIRYPDFNFLAEVRGRYRSNGFVVTLIRDRVVNKALQTEKESIVWKKGMRIEALYLGMHDEEYFFESRVIRAVKKHDFYTLLCEDTSAVRQSRRRRYKRRNVDLAATISLVRFDENKKPVMYAPAPCRLVNLSIGGCALRTPAGENPGTLVAVDFRLSSEERIRCFGKVVRSEKRAGDPNKAFHTRIQFTRATKASINGISNIIYNI
jgi:hypothetical protein